MKKIFIDDKEFYVDVCTDGCGGIYFDSRELKHFDEKDENVEEIQKNIPENLPEVIDENVVRVCPNCNTNMVKHFPAPGVLVEIDECYFCGGIFLDNGELEKIRKESTTDADAVEKLFVECLGFSYDTESARPSVAKRAYDSKIAMPIQKFINKHVFRGEFD